MSEEAVFKHYVTRRVYTDVKDKNHSRLEIFTTFSSKPIVVHRVPSGDNVIELPKMFLDGSEIEHFYEAFRTGVMELAYDPDSIARKVLSEIIPKLNEAKASAKTRTRKVQSGNRGKSDDKKSVRVRKAVTKGTKKVRGDSVGNVQRSKATTGSSRNTTKKRGTKKAANSSNSKRRR